MNGHHTAIHVELTNHRCILQSLVKCADFTALSEPQQSNEYVLLGVFVCEERLPATISVIISPDKLYVLRAYFIVNLLDANFSCSYISAR